MGVATYVCLERSISGVDATSVDGKHLARTQEDLDGIADKNGLEPLSTFVSFSRESLEDMLELSDVDATDLSVPEEQWFDAGRGLATVNGLIEYVRNASATESSTLQIAMHDLESIQRVLEVARSHDVRFHLAIDI